MQARLGYLNSLFRANGMIAISPALFFLVAVFPLYLPLPAQIQWPEQNNLLSAY